MNWACIERNSQDETNTGYVEDLVFFLFENASESVGVFTLKPLFVDVQQDRFCILFNYALWQNKIVSVARASKAIDFKAGGEAKNKFISFH